MGSRRVQIVILAEDRQHDVFLRRFLKAIGKADERQIRTVPFPAGRGSGEQFVREKYPVELRAHRSKANHLAVQLFVVTDADVLLVEQRRQQLSAPLVDAGISLPTHGEAVAILIPRRNIETWIYYLNGQSVDETTTYRKLAREGECQTAVDRFEELYRSGWTLPDDCPDSLRQSVEELKRVLVL
jgi:hypothetical protein